ncbi:proline iminopeptidase [Corynebacterium phocae]|uniref:Proline iminopeptidase n=1 Tax=Corynebacterium phocae TaxID=161895 RepID=A0A1L7D1R6_9CORY|nr:alpha/beta fold hydrolase [Corynebacterium phocae]APT92017.1 proline iminopeptidase [Corynebacterium phocae]KAA8726393.1 alpha/beta hydrolase [Corynebacterium phocae]
MATMTVESVKRFGHTIKEHTISVPWDYDNPGETFELFAREVIAPGGEDKPALVYFQGGPGFPAPRPVGTPGLLGKALERYRLILLDQRGTGRSHRIDSASPAADLEKLKFLRQDNIARDAERLREHLGEDKWSMFGQSFGGFCITSYLSLFPESVERAYFTGGLPTLDKGADELYRSTYRALHARQEKFYREIPWAKGRVEEIIHHLDNAEELLPTGERLSSRRFRTVGIELGRGTGFDTLAYLLEDPFREVKGEKRLRTDFLADVGARVSFYGAPLYAAIHESIYGAVGGQKVTGWSAHRVREEFEDFAESGTWLTGEHIYPWQFDEDPALRPLKEAAFALAEHEWESSPYDAEALGKADAVAAAAVYLDDIFVPFEESMDTAAAYKDLRPHVTNKFQHNGIAEDGAGIFGELLRLADDH